MVSGLVLFVHVLGVLYGLVYSMVQGLVLFVHVLGVLYGLVYSMVQGLVLFVHILGVLYGLVYSMVQYILWFRVQFYLYIYQVYSMVYCTLCFSVLYGLGFSSVCTCTRALTFPIERFMCSFSLVGLVQFVYLVVPVLEHCLFRIPGPDARKNRGPRAMFMICLFVFLMICLFVLLMICLFVLLPQMHACSLVQFSQCSLVQFSSPWFSLVSAPFGLVQLVLLTTLFDLPQMHARTRTSRASSTLPSGTPRKTLPSRVQFEGLVYLVFVVWWFAKLHIAKERERARVLFFLFIYCRYGKRMEEEGGTDRSSECVCGVGGKGV